jgi:Ca-activated chloride channel family protein
MRHAALLCSCLAAALLLTLSCSVGEDGARGAPSPTPPSAPLPNAGRGFGQLRTIIASGEVPSPEVLSLDVFLDEHEAPRAAPCAQPVCLYAGRGAGYDLRTGTPRGWLLVSLTPGLMQHARVAKRLIVAVDTSSSMAGPPMQALREGLVAMQPKLSMETAQLVSFSEQVQTRAPIGRAQVQEWAVQVAGLEAGGGSDLQAGLREALELALEAGEPPARVLFIADGGATAGLTSEQRLRALARAYGEAGVELSTLGLGRDFPSRLLHGLQQSSLGSFYHVESLEGLSGALAQEASTTRVRLAEAIELELVSQGTTVVASYGADEVEPLQRGLRVKLNAAGVERRGGVERARLASSANVLLIELGTSQVSDDTLDLVLRYQGFDGVGREVARVLPAPAPVAVRRRRGEDKGAWDDAAVERFAVVISVHDVLREALELYARGDARGALRGLEAFIERLEGWLRDHDAQDVYQDLTLLRQLADTIRLRAGVSD